MRILDAFLLHLDNAWEHEWESLLGVLAGVEEDEASWQPACYRDVPHTDGWPPPGTIRWQVAHIGHCKRGWAARLRSARESRTPDLPHRPTATFADDLEELRDAHADQRAAICEITDPELTPGVADFLANTIRHDIWHAAQIAVARRLWRQRSAGA